MADSPAATLVDTNAACSAAEGAATRARVQIQLAHSKQDIQDVVGLIDLIWASDDNTSILPFAQLRAMTHAGNYAAIARRDGRPVGCLVGFLGWHEQTTTLHSHIAAARPGATGAGIGYALKLHQRAWALQRGLRSMTWTFDPLVRRNAYFNLAKLGAAGVHYHQDFYGHMLDAVNGDDDTDRLLVRWDLAADHVARASTATLEEPEALHCAASDGLLLDVIDDLPVARQGTGDVLGARVPADIEALRQSDPSLGREWRHALRDTLGAAVADGAVATYASRDGLYLLRTNSGPGLTAAAPSTVTEERP